MGGLFYNWGRSVGTAWRKGKWAVKSLTGSEVEIIRAEYDVGRDMSRAVVAEGGLDSDPATARLLEEVGPRLVGRLRGRRRTFAFQVLAMPEVNAFALPGGFIFVTRSLLELCEWGQDEAAFILAHEMAHAVKGHATDRLMNSMATSAASKVGLGGRMLHGRLVELGLHLLRQAYSQDQELEADAFGSRLAQSAGFDPRAAAVVLEKLKDQAAGVGESELMSYFSSHPPADLRLAELKRLFRRQGV